ncbi:MULTISPECIES: putative hemolysin [Aeromonas]|uniref:putative hemolysin n=1 Tax=Aeromonas TaxID=642 RepID=UPI0005C1975E|nr:MULTISPECIES: DUF333 domain-containing protein [Aeromonas]MBP4042822.1 DUF333 domain-containing protein [Aeromonas sp. SrichE-2G]
MIKPLIALLPALLLSACASEKAPTPVGMANPASVYCGEQGGKVIIKQEANGAVGYCHLPDGQVAEEWAFYRSTHP